MTNSLWHIGQRWDERAHETVNSLMRLDVLCQLCSQQFLLRVGSEFLAHEKLVVQDPLKIRVVDVSMKLNSSRTFWRVAFVARLTLTSIFGGITSIVVQYQ